MPPLPRLDTLTARGEAPGYPAIHTLPLAPLTPLLLPKRLLLLLLLPPPPPEWTFSSTGHLLRVLPDDKFVCPKPGEPEAQAGFVRPCKL